MTMNTAIRILYFNEGEDPALWLPQLQAALPEAEIRLWSEGDNAPADYALVWKPPRDMLSGRTGLKAIFNLAAGVDSLMEMKEILPAGLPVMRLEDAGMAVQMAEYVTHAVLRYFRHFDQYALQAKKQEWKPLEPTDRNHFSIGIMGMGAMGERVAKALLHFDFPVKGWSKTPKTIPGVSCFTGEAGLNDFLSGTKLLICLLPLTAETTGILSKGLFSRLSTGAFLVNVGRGAHLIEEDLVQALDSGQIKAATLDVSSEEPLPPSHPFWHDKRITITPHVAALTLLEATVRQVRDKLRAFERGMPVTGIVNMERGY